MNGSEWMENLLGCEQTRQNIPLAFQVTLPLPGRHGAHTAECWYYRLECQSDGPQLYSPERYVLWNIETMEIVSMTSMLPVHLGSGKDVLTETYRRQEDAFLDGPFTDFLNNGSVADVTRHWLAAAPQAMRPWLENALKEER